MFSTTEDGDLVAGGTHYYPGITYKLDGVVVTMAYYTANFGSATKKTVTIKIADDAPNTLWYWCHHHTGQGNKINVSNTWQAPAAGSGTFVGLTDTPANFTSQAGKYLKVNAGATALEYVTLPVDPDTNTTYSQSSVADGSNVKLRLTDSGSTNDDILITAGNNITISNVTANGFTIASTASGGGAASVTTDDSAPSSPSDGDLWWKSDEGRLKIYYQDTDSSQWVDAFPVQTPTTLTVGNSSISITDTGSNGNIAFNTDGTDRWKITSGGHIIPYTNAAFDIGNAEYKIRHLFLSDNTVYFQGSFLKVAQHDAGGAAQAPSYLIPLAKLKDALNASGDYEAFKAAIIAIADA